MNTKNSKELEKEITKLKNTIQKLRKEANNERWNKLTAYSSVALAIFSGITFVITLLFLILNRYWPTAITTK